MPLIDETPTIGTGGKKIAFIHPKGTGGVLVELYELTAEEPMRRLESLLSMPRRFQESSSVYVEGIRSFLASWRTSEQRSYLPKRWNRIAEGDEE